ncbi:MAG TPA: hypothetical protein VIG25_05195 [Pyrinomonadaceae bacterium]|jgi:hypothetical protein
MGQHTGSFGTISYDANDPNIHIEIDPAALGDLALTSADGRIECYWDGTQWVCNSVTFAGAGSGQSPNQVQAQAAKKL